MKSTSERFRGRRSIFSLALLLCLVPLADPAVAGQGQEASIIGQITDESGGVLPGVTVTATSPALQVRQVTDVSNERGEYRLTPLPLGTYAVQYELSGFGTVRREDVQLSSGFTALVDISLKVGTLAETVTVSGAAPVVDVASAAVRTQLTRETLDVIPTGRNGIQTAMSQAPGVRTNLDFGNTGGNPVFRAFGQGFESWTTFEGVSTTSMNSANNGSGNEFDQAALEEATVQTVGSSAEAPTRGIQVSIILKSGGDDFHGGAFFAQSSQRLQSDNVNDALRAQGITSADAVKTRWDRSGELGGRIIRNKLWFYSAARARREDDVVTETFMPDGSPAVAPRRIVYSTIKVSYQMSQAHKFIGFYQNDVRTSETVINQFTDWGSRQIGEGGPDTSKIEWQFAKGNKFVSLQWGNWLYNTKRQPASEEIGSFDQLTQRVTGRNDQTPTIQLIGREHDYKGTLGWYKPGLFWGNHDIKAGFSYAVNQYSDRQTFDRGAAQNYRHIFRNGVPFQLEAHNNPVNPRNTVDSLGTYVQDIWTIARRLTLNLGVRYAHDNGGLPEQCRVAARPPLDTLYPAQCFPRVQFKKWNSVVPRLHAAYDLTGDAKTVIKGGWGRFAHMRSTDEVLMANENAHIISFFRWNDRNGNKVFDLGEVNFDRNGPDFVSSRLQVADTLAGAVPNPNETEPMTDELSLSIERQLIPNFAVRLTGVYSRNTNTYRVQNNLRPYGVYNIPITNRDPGPDRTLGTADDPGTFITYYDYPAAYAGRSFQQPMLISDPRADPDFKSVEVAASKRLSNRWQFMASYSATKLHIPYVSNTGGGLSVDLTTFDPNAEINAANNSWEWLSRVSGAYTFPADVQLSANFEHRSGDPWGRTVSFTGGRQIPSITLRVEPIGSRRLPSINLLHLRIEKSIRLTQGQRVALRLNVFNLMNINTVLGVTALSGPNFLRPTLITPPRIAELSAVYSF